MKLQDLRRTVCCCSAAGLGQCAAAAAGLGGGNCVSGWETVQSSTAVLCALCTQALLCAPEHSVHSALCTEHMHPSALQYTVYMHLLYSLLLLQCTQYTQYCCYAVQMKGLTAVIVHCAVYTNTNIKVEKYRYKSTKVQIHANAFSANCHAQCIQCTHCPVCHLI